MNWLRLRKATQPDSDEDGVPGRPQWDADYRLQAYPAMGMFEEYLEMGMSFVYIWCTLVAWCCNSSSVIQHINKVILRRAQLVLVLMTVCKQQTTSTQPCITSPIEYQLCCSKRRNVTSAGCR